MPDLTPDVTTTPNFDPGRVAIASGWLVYDVGYHTCGGYGPESGYAHEPGCGAEPMCEVADIPDLLAAAAERDALAATVERVRALHAPYYPLRDGRAYCGVCEGDEFAAYPGPTALALDALPAPEHEDPRVELLAEELEAASGCCFDSWPCREADRWYRDARLILARLDAVRADA